MPADSNERLDKPRDRRAFLGQLATGAAAGAGALALSGVAAAMPEALSAATPRSASDADHWLDSLKGKHKQLVDAINVNDGWPLGFAYTFLATLGNDTGGAVIVLRHFAMPMALQDSLWAKYKIGESLKVIDPETKQPAVKNPFYKPKAGVLAPKPDDVAISRLMARGVIFGACNVALAVLSNAFAGNAGVTPDEAKKEWTAGLLPGVALLPSGTYGVNRAQEKGCTYCSGG